MGGATMRTKNLVLIAYLFWEIYYGLLITRKNNIFRSFGLERFIGAFDSIENYRSLNNIVDVKLA